MDNSFQKQALDLVAENEALKCQSAELKQALVMLFNGGWDAEHNNEISNIVKDVLSFTPEQCLNSVKADAITEAIEALNPSQCNDSTMLIACGAFQMYANTLIGGNG